MGFEINSFVALPKPLMKSPQPGFFGGSGLFGVLKRGSVSSFSSVFFGAGGDGRGGVGFGVLCP